MNPITHLLASWTLSEAAGLERRDRALASWTGLLPDLDGLGAVPDVAARLLGLPDPAFYGRFHHQLLHGLPAALLLPALTLPFARKRGRTYLAGFAAVHLHLLSDLVGSRGPDPDDLWPLHYLAPLSDAATVAWTGQWPVNGWPNVLFTVALMAWAFHRAVVAGTSPVELFGRRAGEAFVATVRARWAMLRRAS